VKILVAEDDKQTAEFIQRGLDELGHNVVAVSNGPDALHMLLAEQFDLSILDRMLPGTDGLSVLRRIRAADVEVPVLLLTALGRIEDRVDGLEAGADDYLIKPFAFSELAARVNALGRRKPLQAEVTRLEHGGLVVDLLKRRVLRDGEAIALQPREFKILEVLMRNAGHVVTRTMLLETVWDYSFDPQTNVVDVHMSRLRQKIDAGFERSLLETVRGAGYRLCTVEGTEG